LVLGHGGLEGVENVREEVIGDGGETGCDVLWDGEVWNVVEVEVFGAVDRCR
jgi:hypothetical protein